MAFHIGYKNLLTHADATVTASSEAVGFEKENAYDGLGYDFWKTSAFGFTTYTAEFYVESKKTANYIAIHGHDLYDHGGSLSVQYWDGTNWITVVPSFIPANNNTIFKSFGSQTAEKWRYVFHSPENLLLYSDDFTQSQWVEVGTGAVTAAQSIAPDGTAATLLTDSDADANEYRITQSVTIANDALERTFSVYLKDGGATSTTISIACNGGTGISVTGIITWSTNTMTGGTLTDEGGGWYKASVTITNNSSGNTTCICSIYPAGAAATDIGSTFSWRAQLEEGSSVIGSVKTEAAINTSLPSIAGIQIGETLEMPRNAEVGFSVPTLAPKIELKTALSEDGSFIGGSKKSQGIEGRLKFTNLDPAWVRSDWEPFLAYAQTPAPFVVSWDTVTYIDEIMFAWVDGDISPPSYSGALYMSVGLKIKGTK